MSVEMKGMEELIETFNSLKRTEKNKVLKSAVHEAAKIMLEAQKVEVPSSRARRHGLTLKKASLGGRATQDGFSYVIGMPDRGGKAFTTGKSKDNIYRAMWFQYWGFVTLKNWSPSKRKHTRKYPRRITKPIYHPPDLWLDRAFDNVQDKCYDTIKQGLIDGIKSSTK